MTPRQHQLDESFALLALRGRSYFTTPAERQRWRGINIVVKFGRDEPRILRYMGKCGDGTLVGRDIESHVWGQTYTFHHDEIIQFIPWL